MKEIKNYMDDLKQKTGSDYKTAQLMNIDRANVSQIRSRNRVGDDNAVKMAEILGIAPEEILISAAICRSKGKIRDAWAKIAAHYVALKCLTNLESLIKPRRTDSGKSNRVKS